MRKAVDLVFNWCGFCPCFLTILKLRKNQNLNYLKLRSSVVCPPRCSDNVLKLSHLLACLVEALGLHVWSWCSLCRPWHHVPEVGLHPWNNVLCSDNLLCLTGWVWKMMVRVWKLIWEGGILKHLTKAKTPEDSRGRKERDSHRAPGIPCSSEEEAQQWHNWAVCEDLSFSLIS